jgi:hypothetical protein
MYTRTVEVRYVDNRIRTFEVFSYIDGNNPRLDVKIGSGKITYGTIDQFIRKFGLRETISLVIQREIWKRDLDKESVKHLLSSWRSRINREGFSSTLELTINA